jgi:hypothetical protein
MIDGQLITNLRFWAQMIEDSKRTLYCQPGQGEAVKATVAAEGMDGMFTVRETPVCPEGRVIIVDEQALEAAYAETLQKWRL